MSFKEIDVAEKEIKASKQRLFIILRKKQKALTKISKRLYNLKCPDLRFYVWYEKGLVLIQSIKYNLHTDNITISSWYERMGGNLHKYDIR